MVPSWILGEMISTQTIYQTGSVAQHSGAVKSVYFCSDNDDIGVGKNLKSDRLEITSKFFSNKQSNNGSSNKYGTPIQP